MEKPAPDDHAAWVRSAVDRHEWPLILYASRLMGDDDAARDVVQETFLRLCSQSRADLEGRLAEWLFTVCRNRAVDVLRKDRRMSRIASEVADNRQSPEPEPIDVVEGRETASRLFELLAGLPAGQREVIRLKFQNGFSYREISRISGYSVGNVGYLIHVGLKAIRAKLADPEASRTKA